MPEIKVKVDTSQAEESFDRIIERLEKIVEISSVAMELFEKLAAVDTEDNEPT